MRAHRLAPPCALLVTVAATAVAAVTSRASDWDKPLVILLIGALALIADRYLIRTPTGSIVVATHPVFVLGMVVLGPGPLLIIGQLVILANRPKIKGGLAGNAGIYAAFLTAGALLGRVAREHLGVAASSAWFALAV